MYQYMECVFVQNEMIRAGYANEQIANGWGTLHDRYQNSTGHYFVWRRELQINTMAIGFRNVVSMEEARGLATGYIVIKNDFLVTRVIWESMEQLLDLIEKDRWVVIGVFHMYTLGIASGHTEVVMIRFENTPVVVYPHEKILGRVQRVLAL